MFRFHTNDQTVDAITDGKTSEFTLGKWYQFNDNDGKKLPYKKNKLLMCYSFYYPTLLKALLCDVHFVLKNLTTNEAETFTGKLYYMHRHSQWVWIHVMAENLQI